MGKLAQLAGAKELTGKVQVNGQDGIAHVYEDEAAAEAVWGGQADRLEHRRGAFFETGKPKPKATTVAAVDDMVVVAEPPKKSKRNRRKPSGDDAVAFPEP